MAVETNLQNHAFVQNVYPSLLSLAFVFLSQPILQVFAAPVFSPSQASPSILFRVLSETLQAVFSTLPPLITSFFPSP